MKHGQFLEYYESNLYEFMRQAKIEFPCPFSKVIEACLASEWLANKAIHSEYLVFNIPC